jgi:hypothetical protein
VLSKTDIDRIMDKLGYRTTYDNGRRKIWSTTTPPRPGAAMHLDLRYPIRRSDLERVLLDKAVVADAAEIDRLLD